MTKIINANLNPPDTETPSVSNTVSWLTLILYFYGLHFRGCRILAWGRGTCTEIEIKAML